MGQMMPNWLKKRADLTPKRPAIVFRGKTITYAELYHASVEMAGKLTSIGVSEKQFVGLLLRNHIESAVILLALQLIGVRAVILNNRLTAEEISWQLSDSSSVFLISEGFFADKSQKIKDTLPTITVVTKEHLQDVKSETPSLSKKLI